MNKTDLLIIGSGPGGYETAAYAAAHGLQVTIVEEKWAGGTCLNSGCIPTKSLVHDAAKAMASGGGAEAFAAAMQRKGEVVSGLRSGVEQLLSRPGITLVHGHATLLGALQVKVGEEIYEARDIIIATGSRAKLPPVPGLGVGGDPVSPYVVTSEELLDRPALPASLCIVGAGVIGMELASVYASFGCEVTVVEFLKECLPSLDSEMAKRIRKAMEKRGVRFVMNAGVERIDGGTVTYRDRKTEKEGTVEAECILVATGRRPNTDGLGLEAAGVQADGKGIAVDDNMCTQVPHVYAIGDVNGRQLLAHAATFQGERAVNHILGKADEIRLDIMPAAVFTMPEAASVGVTDDACKAQGRTCTTHKAIYRANGRAQAMEETEGLVKLVCDEHDVIIGCHVLGAEAAGLVQEVAALMNFNITRSRLADIIHIHPTLHEILLDAARH
jgi:dihydrolipoamide dehydrogenase